MKFVIIVCCEWVLLIPWVHSSLINMGQIQVEAVCVKFSMFNFVNFKAELLFKVVLCMLIQISCMVLREHKVMWSKTGVWVTEFVQAEIDIERRMFIYLLLMVSGRWITQSLTQVAGGTMLEQNSNAIANAQSAKFSWMCCKCVYRTLLHFILLR